MLNVREGFLALDVRKVVWVDMGKTAALVTGIAAVAVDKTDFKVFMNCISLKIVNPLCTKFNIQ